MFESSNMLPFKCALYFMMLITMFKLAINANSVMGNHNQWQITHEYDEINVILSTLSLFSERMFVAILPLSPIARCSLYFVCSPLVTTTTLYASTALLPPHSKFLSLYSSLVVSRIQASYFFSSRGQGKGRIPLQLLLYVPLL